MCPPLFQVKGKGHILPSGHSSENMELMAEEFHQSCWGHFLTCAHVQACPTFWRRTGGDGRARSNASLCTAVSRALLFFFAVLIECQACWRLLSC